MKKILIAAVAALAAGAAQAGEREVEPFVILEGKDAIKPCHEMPYKTQEEIAATEQCFDEARQLKGKADGATVWDQWNIEAYKEPRGQLPWVTGIVFSRETISCPESNKVSRVGLAVGCNPGTAFAWIITPCEVDAAYGTPRGLLQFNFSDRGKLRMRAGNGIPEVYLEIHDTRRAKELAEAIRANSTVEVTTTLGSKFLEYSPEVSFTFDLTGSDTFIPALGRYCKW